MEYKLIRFKDGLICPYCQGRQVVLWGKRNQVQRYRCKQCRKLFNDLTGTPMARSKLLHKWPKAAAAMQRSLTIRETAQFLNVCVDTAFRWRHRMLTGVSDAHGQVILRGLVEIDEACFRYSEKGARGLRRKPRKRGDTLLVRGRSKGLVYAVVARNRMNETRSFLLARMSGRTLAKEAGSALSREIVLCSDSWRSYRSLALQLGMKHVSLRASRGQKRVHGVYHIQSVISYLGRLQTWIRRFKGVATKYLLNYLVWHEHLDEARKFQRGLGEQKMFISAVSAARRIKAA